jgi:hypothetical protein
MLHDFSGKYKSFGKKISTAKYPVNLSFVTCPQGEFLFFLLSKLGFKLVAKIGFI